MTDAADIITIIFGGKSFRCSRRTAAHLEWTAEELDRKHPHARIVVIQGSYNSTVAASAGTHDYDACLDVSIVSLDWPTAQRFLRECGWAAWVRSPPTFSWHVHMISLGYPGHVGVYVPGQVDDYYRHALGLKGQHDSGSDNTWHPADINSTIFDYPEWEDRMKPEDFDRIQAMLDAQRASIVKDFLAAAINKAGDSVRKALRLSADLDDR